MPGCETVRLIYDRADRLVLEQNGTQRACNRWTVHKYDAIGRLLYSFEHTDATDIATLRNRLSGIWATESDSENDPLGIGYTNTTVGWGSDVRLLEVNYYDDYSFLDKLTSTERNALTYAARSGYDTCHTYADGLPTGNRHYLPDGTGRYVATVLYYDSKGRTVQQTRTNLKGGYDRDSYANSFTGQVTKHFYTHTGSASDTGSLTCEYFYMYDPNDRLVAVDCALNGGTRSALYRLSYDSYGRMQQKTFGNGLYASTYDYNLRGWLTAISGSKFSQNLYYNTGNGTPCYNGNISSMTWKAGNETMLRGYKFTYDGLNRMLDAVYGEGTSLNSNANRFTEKVTGYDKNGNILALQRYGQTSASGYGLIDNLTFTLNGNQLNRVDDAVTASAYNNGFEFKDAVKQANEYAYDANGNLTKDLNKNISNIQYNCLNLPRKVTFTDGSTIEYTYAADGTKLRTKHVINGTTTTTDYCGNVVYENGVQKLMLTEADYLTLTDGKYHYYLQDHQGNNRVVIDQNGTVEETNHYYPFGGVFASTSFVQPYKYNGKELDTKKGLNWYHYGARHYDAAVERFATVDPMAEDYSNISTYTYCLNNPIKYIDPNGMQSDDTIVDGGTLPEVTITRVRVAPPISGFWDNLLWFLFGRSMEIPVYGIDNYGNPTGEIVGSSQFNVSRNGYIIGLTPRSGIAPLPSLGIKNITQLLKIANQNSKAGLTVVGRALKKHGDRIGSAFPKAVGNQAAINAQGEKVLKEILSNPNVQRTVNNNNIGRYGGSVVDYKIPNGMGARFNSNESKFIGFLEP